MFFTDEEGRQIDAQCEVSRGSIVLQSRSGANSDPRKRNTEYGEGLRLLLKRVGQSHLRLSGAWIDSKPSQLLPILERQILFPEDTVQSPEKLFTLISNRMRKVGRPKGESGNKGNNTKKLRFNFEGNPGIEQICSILGLVNRGPDLVTTGDETFPIPPDSEDREWAEGSRKAVFHFTRERIRGLAQAKKQQVKKRHGRLVCEECGLDPIEVYGETFGEACIEVHHDVPLSTAKGVRKTRLEDLKCVCANCHRIIHRKIRIADQS